MKGKLAAIALLSLVIIFAARQSDAAIFTVWFDSTGGSDVEAYIGITHGSLIAVPVQPWRNGAEFLGWYIDEDLEYPWNFSSDRVTSDITLYAKWKNVYRVRIVNGYASRKYAAPGERVEIRAYAPSYWERFDKWVASTNRVTFANRYHRETSFTMPSTNVTVEAWYRDDDDWDDDWFGVGGSCSSGGTPALAILIITGCLLLRRRRGGKSEK